MQEMSRQCTSSNRRPCSPTRHGVLFLLQRIITLNERDNDATVEGESIGLILDVHNDAVGMKFEDRIMVQWGH